MTDKYQDLREAISNAEYSADAYWLDRYRGESGLETIRGLLAERDALQAGCEQLRKDAEQQPDMDRLAGFLVWLDAFVAISAQAGIDDHEEAWTWPAPPSDPGFFDSYPQLTAGDLRAVHSALAAYRQGGGE